MNLPTGPTFIALLAWIIIVAAVFEIKSYSSTDEKHSLLTLSSESNVAKWISLFLHIIITSGLAISLSSGLVIMIIVSIYNSSLLYGNGIITNIAIFSVLYGFISGWILTIFTIVLFLESLFSKVFYLFIKNERLSVTLGNVIGFVVSLFLFNILM